MRAVRLDAPGRPLRVEDVPQPEPSGTEVRIRVAGCGVCHTDLHIVDGTQTRVELPLTLGHEVAGWIDAVGTDADAALAAAGLGIGDAVVVHGGWGCGTCRECASGAEQRCADGRSPGFQADGGYAEMMLVPHPRHLVDARRSGSDRGRATGRCGPDLLSRGPASTAVAGIRRASARRRCRRPRPIRPAVPPPAPRYRRRALRRRRRAVSGAAGARDGTWCGRGPPRSGCCRGDRVPRWARRRRPRLRRQRRDARARRRGRRAGWPGHAGRRVRRPSRGRLRATGDRGLGDDDGVGLDRRAARGGAPGPDRPRCGWMWRCWISGTHRPRTLGFAPATYRDVWCSRRVPAPDAQPPKSRPKMLRFSGCRT